MSNGIFLLLNIYSYFGYYKMKKKTLILYFLLVVYVCIRNLRFVIIPTTTAIENWIAVGKIGRMISRGFERN